MKKNVLNLFVSVLLVSSVSVDFGSFRKIPITPPDDLVSGITIPPIIIRPPVER